MPLLVLNALLPPSNTCSPEDIHSPEDTHTPWQHSIPHGATHSLGQPHGGCNSPVGPGVPLSTPPPRCPTRRRARVLACWLLTGVGGAVTPV